MRFLKRFVLGIALLAGLFIPQVASAWTTHQTAVLSGSNSWVLPGQPSFDIDWVGKRAYVSGKYYYNETDIKNLFSTYSTPAHYVLGTDGILYLAPANAIDCFYVPSGVCLGLMSEAAATNLALRSQDFSNASWAKTGSSVAGSQVAPDGTSTAWTITEDSSAANSHVISQGSLTKSSGSIITASAYVKAPSAGRWWILRIDVSGTGALSLYDLAGNSTLNASLPGGWTSQSSSIQPVGNGWYRIVLTVTSDTSTSFNVRLQFANAFTFTGNPYTYNGDGVSNGTAWGLQAELGTFPTSYIPTTTASVTRAITDVKTSTGSWFNNLEGTLFSDWQVYVAQSVYTGGRPMQLANAASETTNLIRLNTSGTTAVAYNVTDSGVAQASISAGNSGVAYTQRRAAARYKANDFQLASDGSLGTAGTSGTVPTVDLLRIGRSNSASANLQGYERRTTYWPTAKNDNFLQMVKVP